MKKLIFTIFATLLFSNLSYAKDLSFEEAGAVIKAIKTSLFEHRLYCSDRLGSRANYLHLMQAMTEYASVTINDSDSEQPAIIIHDSIGSTYLFDTQVITDKTLTKVIRVNLKVTEHISEERNVGTIVSPKIRYVTEDKLIKDIVCI